MAEPFQPLTGISILAWEQAVALPMATRLLADLGATVIRLESHTRARPRPRYLGNDLARNKSSLAIDLRDARGQDLVKRLAADVDVVCENFTPRVKRQFGLTYESLSAARPDLIMLSLSGYGQTGAWSERPTYGPGIESAAGHAQSMGHADQPPTRPGTVVYADTVTGLYAAFAILAALQQRRQTGRGQSIDLSMYEANAFHLTLSLAKSALTGKSEERRGNASPEAMIQGVYATREPEHWLAVTVRREDQRALAALLGAPLSPTALENALSAWAAQQTAASAAGVLQAAGVAASPALNAKEVLLNEQLRDRQAFTMVQHDQPVYGYRAHPHIASPWVLDEYARPPLREAPAVGQDSHAILQERLGLADAAIDALVEAGVVGKPPGTSPEPAKQPTAVEIERKLSWKLIAGADVDPGAVLGLAPDGGAHPAALEHGPAQAPRQRNLAGGRLRILDLSRGVAGAYCAQILALAGAEVWRVDSDPQRFPANDVRGLNRQVLSRGKRQLTLDLNDAGGRTRLLELLTASNGVVEDLGPGGLEAYGLEPQRLRERSPGLVLTRISPFGQTGPWSSWSGSELIALASGGMLFLTGMWDRPPVQLAPYQAALSTGLTAAIAMLAAFAQARPVTIDIAAQEVVATFIAPALTEYVYNGVIPAREGRVAGMTRIEMASDTWVYAGPSAPGIADYRRFAAFLELPELAQERFATQEGRMEHWQEHQDLVLPRLRQRTAQEWVDAAEAAHLTFGFVQTTSDLLESTVLRERGFFGELPVSNGTACLPLAPYLVDGVRPQALVTLPKVEEGVEDGTAGTD